MSTTAGGAAAGAGGGKAAQALRRERSSSSGSLAAADSGAPLQPAREQRLGEVLRARHQRLAALVAALGPVGRQHSSADVPGGSMTRPAISAEPGTPTSKTGERARACPSVSSAETLAPPSAGTCLAREP